MRTNGKRDTTESPRSKRKRRLRDIDRAAANAAKLREKYRTDSNYRAAKIAAARRQNAALTTHQKGINSERRIAARRRKSSGTEKSSWQRWTEADNSISLYELISPSYVVERHGQTRQVERWPMNDPAALFIECHERHTENATKKPVSQST